MCRLQPDNMPGIQTQDEALIQLLHFDKKKGFETLYKEYAPLLYGFILRTTANTVIAAAILLQAFTFIYREIHKFDPSRQSIFIWMLNITRDFLRVNDNCVAGSGQPHEYILYKGMSCEQAAGLTNQLPTEIKTNLHMALQHIKR